MGAWGIHFDESDGSLDFLGEVEESRDWSDVRHRLRDYVANGGYDDAEEAIAALELVAAARGRASLRLTPELRAWSAEQMVEPDDLAVALEAASLVIEKSELSELWAEADEGDDWKATVVELRTRLLA